MRQDELDRRVAEMFPGLHGGQFTANKFRDPLGSSDQILMPSGRPVIEDDFDIRKLIADSKDPDTGLLRDLKIDDRDLPGAKNYYDYSYRIIGKDDNPPWMVQMWTGLLLFGEICPSCSNKKWLDLEWFVDHVPKDRPSSEICEGIQLLAHGKCPKCKRKKWELIKDHGLNNYIELVNCLGQRSGKSSSAAHYASYHTHRFLKFPSIGELVTNSMRKSTELTSTFVSLSYAKAIGVLWTPYHRLIQRSSWFQQYHRMLDHFGNKYGTELYKLKDEYIKWYHRSMQSYASGPKATTLRGDTRILACIDELGLFPLPTGNDEEDEQSERANADEAHKSLTSSLVTVQSIQIELLKQGLNCPPALMMGVSSPISIRDKVMRLLADSRTDGGRKSILGVNLPTWKVNPSLHRDSPFIQLKYAANAEKTERDFGANPPRVNRTFMAHTQVPNKIWNVKNTHTLVYQYDQPGLLYAKLRQIYTPKYPSLVTIDAGHTNNSFTLTGAHFDFARQKTVVSTVLELMTHDQRKIDFNLVYENVILPCLKHLNSVGLIADQWQSLDILSRARADMGQVMINGKLKDRCLAKQYSPKRKDFDALVAMTENGSFELPFLSEADYEDVKSTHIEFKTLVDQPVKHLLLQMLTVTEVGPLRCPTKGPGFTDDIFRALVLQTLIHTEAVMQRLKDADMSYVQERRAMPKGAFIGRSGY
jgi:hypothetical protein